MIREIKRGMRAIIIKLTYRKCAGLHLVNKNIKQDGRAEGCDSYEDIPYNRVLLILIRDVEPDKHNYKDRLLWLKS